jgi:5-aminolevulinate synthase
VLFESLYSMDGDFAPVGAICELAGRGSRAFTPAGEPARLKRLICDAALPLLPTDSHILPLMVGNSEQCQKASALLLEEHAIYIQPINYPTVPKGAERLRITPSPFHTDSQTDYLVEALVNVWDRLGLWR